MDIEKAKVKGFTHIGRTYNVVKIYVKNVSSESPDVIGINLFYNVLLEIAIWLDLNFGLNEGFHLEVTELK